jgi:hypothetical protein
VDRETIDCDRRRRADRAKAALRPLAALAARYDDKWTYVRQNPVRAGLAAKVEDWPFADEIETLDL